MIIPRLEEIWTLYVQERENGRELQALSALRHLNVNRYYKHRAEQDYQSVLYIARMLIDEITMMCDALMDPQTYDQQQPESYLVVA